MPDDDPDYQRPTPGDAAARPRWRTPRTWTRRRWIGSLVAVFVIGAASATAALEVTSSSEPGPAVGALSEPVHELPDGLASVTMSDGLEDWGLVDVSSGGSGDPLGGGAALGDVDGDGDSDLVVANGAALLLEWTGEAFAAPVNLGVEHSVAVAIGDLDGDQRADVVIARAASTDVVLWGAERELGEERTELAGGDPSAAVMIAELNGDGRADLLRLARGEGVEAPDVIWIATGEPRSFDPIALRTTGRLSLAGELADIDGDGLLDIWVTRDVGWDLGGDSLYSRQGVADGPWVDVAAELGTNLEVDGMGVTLADLDADGALDAYVSDIGDNEMLIRRGERFGLVKDSGAARIRPPGAGPDVVSSSWGTAATDLNLDGRTDLVAVGGGFGDSEVRNKIDGTTVAEAEPPALLVGVGGGRYVDVWPSLGLDLELTGRGLTVGDVDGDGDPDLVAVATDGSVMALRNESRRPSLTLRSTNCPAGTVVTVSSGEVSAQQLLAPHSYAGHHDASILIGVEGPRASAVVAAPGRAMFTQEVDVSQGREAVELDCG